MGKNAETVTEAGRRAPADEPPAGREAAARQLLRQGPDDLADHELLALWLSLPMRRAAELLRRYPGLPGQGVVLLQAEPDLGPGRVARLKAAAALVERWAVSGLTEAEAPLLSCTRSVRRFLRWKLAPQPREVFACLFLDSRHRLIRYEVLFMGTVDRASVHPREVLRRALELNAAALILAHNHPSGIAEPSVSDVALTRDLGALLKQIDVRLLDHLVVGRGSDVSLAERGLLD